MLAGDNEMDTVECPYNKSHRMMRKRLQPHLLKCRVNYPDVELQKCPFNILHLIPEPEFVHHVTSCPDRKLITQYKYDAPVREEERVKHEPIDCDENWDDTEVEDYNPQKYLETANVLRKPQGTHPSQRKAFIKKERKRLGDIDSDDDEYDDAEMQKRNVLRALKKEAPEVDSVGGDEGRKSYRRMDDTPPFSPIRRNIHRRSPSPGGSSFHSAFSRSSRGRESEEIGFRYRSSFPPMVRYPSPPRYRQYSPPPPAPSMTSPPRRVGNGRTSPEEYDPDEDPYYNGGSSTTSSHSVGYNARDIHPLELPYEPIYAPRNPTGRGGHRGYPYDRSYIFNARGRYEPY